MSQSKKEYRQRLKKAVNQLNDCDQRSISICNQLKKSLKKNAFKVICGFYPLKSEPDIRPVLEWVIQKKGLLVLPRWTETGYQLAACYDLKTLVCNEHRIFEPDFESEYVNKNDIDCCLVPGIGFDLMNNRLGRGKGHYDRLLVDINATILGVCFDVQVVNKLPVEPHDVALSDVIFG